MFNSFLPARLATIHEQLKTGASGLAIDGVPVLSSSTSGAYMPVWKTIYNMGFEVGRESVDGSLTRYIA
jgi:hypothetical protein